MNVVELRDVNKSFDGAAAVADLSFTVKAGSVFGFLGPNGAGKTTSLRMIVDILAPDSGEIRVLGRPPGRQLQPSIGYLPEERGLYSRMKVREQIVFFGALKGLTETEARRRAGEWLERLGLTASAERKLSELSKGNQQKVQFVAAVLHDPELLILDEPFSGLDPVSARSLKDALTDLRRAGKTLIFSTHQMEQVEQLCDDLCLIDQGRQVLAGAVREVKRRFARDTLLLAYTGRDGFVDGPGVRSVAVRPTHVEVQLESEADAQRLLRRAVEAGATITRFELVEPSLEEIFVRTVGEARAQGRPS